MKILIITPRIPYPPFRGDKLKIYNLSRILVKNNEVHLFTFYRKKKDFNDIENLEKLGLKVIAIHFSIFSSLLGLFKALFSNSPFQVNWYHSNKAKKKLEKLQEIEQFDIIYYHLIRTAQYLQVDKKENKPLNVIDLTDAVSLYLNRMLEKERNFLKRIFIRSEFQRINKYEKIIEAFDMVFICSEKDKQFLIEKNISKEINILQNGFDVNYFSPDNHWFDDDRILFTGNMPYYANYDAVIYFTQEIFPLILQKRRTVKFYIVGQNPPRKIRKLQSENIIVTGFVKDIKTEYLKSAVNVAPMRFGAGTLNKVIESLALGVPVVATSIAVGGLPKELSKFVLVADTPIEFADKVISVIENKNIRQTLMSEAKISVKNLLSWEIIVKNFENLLKEKISKTSNA